MTDLDIFPWLNEKRRPTREERYRSSTIVADRLCGAVAEPIVRNAQEKRQLGIIEHHLVAKGYKHKAHPMATPLMEMEPGTFSFRLNVLAKPSKASTKTVRIPIDAVIQPKKARLPHLPLLIEAKSEVGSVSKRANLLRQKSNSGCHVLNNFPLAIYLTFASSSFSIASPRWSLSDAVSLYEQNVALSEMTFGLLHCLEVAIRNSMHDQLTAYFGTPHWFNIAPLSTYSQDKINAAIHDAGGPTASPGKVVAELMFGFWTDLAAQRYHWTLWQPCLCGAFPSVRLARPLIHRRLEDIRWLRNRIAHHEPILTSGGSLYAGHQRKLSLDQLAECSDWISPSIGGCFRTHFRFVEATAVVNAVTGSGWTL